MAEKNSVSIEQLKRLAVFGSVTGKAMALALLDELTNGQLLVELEKIRSEVGGSNDEFCSGK